MAKRVLLEDRTANIFCRTSGIIRIVSPYIERKKYLEEVLLEYAKHVLLPAELIHVFVALHLIRFEKRSLPSMRVEYHDGSLIFHSGAFYSQRVISVSREVVSKSILAVNPVLFQTGVNEEGLFVEDDSAFGYMRVHGGDRLKVWQIIRDTNIDELNGTFISAYGNETMARLWDCVESTYKNKRVKYVGELLYPEQGFKSVRKTQIMRKKEAPAKTSRETEGPSLQLNNLRDTQNSTAGSSSASVSTYGTASVEYPRTFFRRFPMVFSGQKHHTAKKTNNI